MRHGKIDILMLINVFLQPFDENAPKKFNKCMQDFLNRISNFSVE
jgi:hypothetical protein